MFPSLFPKTALRLVLSGTCYASVYGVVVFQVFLREGGLRFLRSILDSQVYLPVTCSLRRLRST